MIAPLLLLLAGWDVDDDYERGMALAREQRWDEARHAFQAGQANAPRDKRFPLELAGLAFRRKDYPTARRELAKALRIDPADRYGNDFLATLYFLDGNLEAALKYWNRAGKPRIENVGFEPKARADPVLLDRAMAFSPAAVLTMDDYLTTTAWLDGLSIFGAYKIELTAQAEERFDATVHWVDPSGWMRLLSVLSETPYQTVRAGMHNPGGGAWNWMAMARWDAQKRRASISAGGPLARNPKWLGRLYTDARSETWNAGGREDFRLRKVEAGLEFRAIPNWRLSWNTGFSIASRHLANAPQWRGGLSMKYRAGVSYQLIRIPERRFTLGLETQAEIARLFPAPGQLYSRGQGGLAARWLPLSRGSDYEMTARLRAGAASGHSPFDEHFTLGVERDNDLWLRGHAGTRGGKKGSAPIGRNYVLAGGDISKQIYRNPLIGWSAGPFVDAGRMRDMYHRFGPDPWLVDSGVQSKVTVPGGLAVSVSVGWALRSGGHAFYASVGRAGLP